MESVSKRPSCTRPNNDSRLIFPQFADIAEQQWRLEVTFNVGLLERLNLAREDVFVLERYVEVLKNISLNEVECKEGIGGICFFDGGGIFFFDEGGIFFFDEGVILILP